MKKLSVTKCIQGVVFLLGFMFVTASAFAGITYNYFYDLNDGASSAPPGWVAKVTGSASRNGSELNVAGGTIVYGRSFSSDGAVCIEGQVSASNIGAGLHMAISNFDSFEHYRIAARLEDEFPIQKIVLWDGHPGGLAKGQINLN